MNVDEAIRNRRSIRKFKPDPLTKEQIKEILDAGNRAPSAKNRVQWRFHVYEGKAKDELVEVCSHGIEDFDRKTTGSATHSFKIMDQAPVVVIVTMTCEWGGLSPELQSVSAAIQNMLLKAHSMGLGSLWIADILYATEALHKHLGMDQDEQFEMRRKEAQARFSIAGKSLTFLHPLVAAVALGYPDEAPVREPRLQLDEITTWH